ncbi:MAG: hypothetical protein VX185_00125 [Pseudomonadota bacterium]|nr:hypothetical protein [Pseudomonadota bacterium]
MSNQCAATVSALKEVMTELQHAYVAGTESNEALDRITQLHITRQSLTSELYATLPSPVPLELVNEIIKLQDATDELRTALLKIQQSSSDEVFKLKSHQKAKKAYSQF